MAWKSQPRDSKGRWTKKLSAGALLTAILIGAWLAYGAGGVPGAGTSGSGSSASGQRAQDRDTSRVVNALRAQNLQVRQVATSAAGDCAANSYGQAQQFFRGNPCTALYRATFEVRDGRQASALLAVAWVDMPDADQARRLQQLIDTHGTGNAIELSGGHAVSFTGLRYASTRNNLTFVNGQAEPLAGNAQFAAQVANAVRAA